jgi:hypothetical protein
MRKPMASIAILVLIGRSSLCRQSAAAAPEREDVEARALLKAANEGLSAMQAEIDTGNVPLTPDLMGRWGQWIRRVYDASVLADPSPATRLKAAEDYLHRAEDMRKVLAMINAENPLVMQRREAEYQAAAAKLEIARIKRGTAGR